MEDKVLKELNHTNLHEKLIKISNIYEKLEKKQITFCNCFDIHCKQNCSGECCENFTPDITETEAEFLAYGLIKENKADLVLELIHSKEESSHHCPLFLKDSNYHCSVYKWRPLICRLFGASASSDKNGNPVFKKCKWNLNGHDVSTTDFERNQKAIVIMSDVVTALNEIEANDTKTALLPEALENAIHKLQFIIELNKENKTN